MTRVLYVYYGTAGIAGNYIHGIGQNMENVADAECHMAVNYYYRYRDPNCKVVRVFFPFTEMTDQNRYLRSRVVRTFRLPLRYAELGLAYLYLLWYIMLRRIEIVNLSLIDDWLATYLFSQAVRMLGKRLYITAHDSVPYTISTPPLARRRKILHSAHKVIVHYQHVREHVVEYFGLPYSKIYVHPFPWSEVTPILDHEKLEGSLASMSELVARHRRVFLFIGVLRPQKGLATLLDAWVKAGFEPEDGCVLLVAGRPVRGQEQVIPPAPTVRLISRYLSDEEFCALLMLADAVVVPYAVRYYAHSAVALMSYLASTCLIASDIPLFEQMVDDEDGYKFKVGDVEELARILAYVAQEDTECLRRKGMIGRERVLAELAGLASSLSELYSEPEKPTSQL
jgi:glycosyltransferase involved in cell wall biosynthesis